MSRGQQRPEVFYMTYGSEKGNQGENGAIERVNHSGYRR